MDCESGYKKRVSPEAINGEGVDVDDDYDELEGWLGAVYGMARAWWPFDQLRDS